MLYALLALPAYAAGWEVGLGTRNDLGEGGSVEGLRLLGRRELRSWAIEAQIYGSPDTERYRDLDAAIVEIGGSSLALPSWRLIAVDQASAAVLADWGFGERQPGGWDGGPRLYAGVEARYQQVYALGYSPQVDPPGDGRLLLTPEETRLVVGPVAGAGLHLSAGARLGARFLLADRMYLSSSPPDDSDDLSDSVRLHHSPTLALDLLVRL